MLYFCDAKPKERKKYTGIIIFTKKKNQLDWLLSIANEQGIPRREYVKPAKQVSPKTAFLKGIVDIGKHAKMIAKGQMTGTLMHCLMNYIYDKNKQKNITNAETSAALNILP